MNTGFQALHVLANCGHPRAAAGLARMTPGGDQPRLKALALTWHLDAGDTVPVSRWKSVCNVALGSLDQELATGSIHPRVTWEVLQLVFHARIQQGPHSPILHDGLNMQSLLIHPVIQRLAGLCQGQSEPTKVASAVKGHADRDASNASCENKQHSQAEQPFHLLIVTDVSTTFIQPAVDWWVQRGVDVRVRNVSDDPVLRRWCAFKQTVTDRLAGTSPEIPASLVPDMTWADTVWVEWCSGLAARLSGARLDQVGNPRLVVRLHRFETLTPAPLLTQWRCVDALIVVAPFVAAIMAGATPAAAVKALRGKVEVVGNVWDPSRYHLPKAPDASHTVALVGWSAPLKDAPWAAALVRELQRQQPDAGWRLLLVGAEPTDPGYLRRCQEAFDSLQANSVVRWGQTDDVPAALQHASVVVSSSQVESQHMGLLEGAASGCIPVVRNWPDVADVAMGDQRMSGARTIYPDPWVVNTPGQGATRVLHALEHTVSEAIHFAQDRGANAVMPELDRVIGRVVKESEL